MKQLFTCTLLLLISVYVFATVRTVSNNPATIAHSGNLTNLVDGKTQNTAFQYDLFGRLTNKLDDASTSILQLTYDAAGRPTVPHGFPGQPGHRESFAVDAGSL